MFPNFSTDLQGPWRAIAASTPLRRGRSHVWVRWLALLGCITLPAVGVAQLPPFPTDPLLQEAYFAWDRGDYDDALVRYLGVLDGPDGPEHREEIALLTGERYQVDEIAWDGRANVRIAPTGRYLLFEARDDADPVTRVHDLNGTNRAPVVLPGVGATFVGERTVAYLSPGAPVADREVRIQALGGGIDQLVNMQGWIPRVGSTSLVGVLVGASDEDILYISASRTTSGPATDILRLDPLGALYVLPTGEGGISGIIPVPGGRHLVFTATEGTGPGAVSSVVVLDLVNETTRRFAGRSAPAISADGRSLTFLGRDGSDFTIEVVAIGEAAPADPIVVVRASIPLGMPALSPSGSQVAFQARPFDDWEIFAAQTEAGAIPRPITNEIQHDLFPRFLDESTILAVKGEGRHRRSYLYDAETGAETKLFHNNTVRTISAEYEWQFAPDGSGVFILADRDGDTISPERGVYHLHLDRTVSMEALRTRLQENLEAERDLRVRGQASFAPIAEAVSALTTEMSVERLYQYGRTLYGMGSKFMTQPGNALAIEYLEAQLREWGYAPELQWFEPRDGVRTANVIARLPGSVDPSIVYVASSHFDSVEPGPGADDNSSGTSALLEAARVLRDSPQPATIEFAFFTAEEAGLLGSREYVRLAQEEGKQIAGALNNDMIGWTNDHRLDNTIRYSNAGIRDIQHGAAILFSDLITYDSHYYQGTDAAAYYEAYGDIVGGIGSYPVLGNPHYHQPTDRLETVNQQLVAEVGRVTLATLMLLASSPARLRGMEVVPGAAAGSVEVSWDAAGESGVTGYRLRYATDGGAVSEVEVPASATARPSVTLEDVAPDAEIAVRAIGTQGLEGWDWARVRVNR